MAIRCVVLVRFRGHYYTGLAVINCFWSMVFGLILAYIPEGTDRYRAWLHCQRQICSETEYAYDKNIFEIREGYGPNYSNVPDFEELPSQVPRLAFYGIDCYITLNLDREVLSINHRVHWRLDAIPREHCSQAMRMETVGPSPLAALEACPAEYRTSLAIELREPNQALPFAYRTVNARMCISGWKAFLVNVMATVLIQYRGHIARHGREWTADAFPYRELVFALVSIASGQNSFLSPRYGMQPHDSVRPHTTPWSRQPMVVLDELAVGRQAPLFEFLSKAHHRGAGPGVSPAETMYWLGNVVVSISLVVNNQAVGEAITWGRAQGTASFQIVVMSLFQVILAEVFPGDDGNLRARASTPIDLSPLRIEHCLSTERPVQLTEAAARYHGTAIINPDYTGCIRRLYYYFPGLLALVNFFDVAENRRLAADSDGRLPLELYRKILDHVTDYETWKVCLKAAKGFRLGGLCRYRIDDSTSIVGASYTGVNRGAVREHDVSCFGFRSHRKNVVRYLLQVTSSHPTTRYNWLPIIGGNPKALVLEGLVQFQEVKNARIRIIF